MVSFVRALELLDLTIADPRWRGRRKELIRTRTFLCDAMDGGKEHGSTLQDLDVDAAMGNALLSPGVYRARSEIRRSAIDLMFAVV